MANIEITKEILERLVAESSSLLQVITKLGYNYAAGGQYTHIKNRAAALGVDLTPVIRNSGLQGFNLDKVQLENLIDDHDGNIAGILRAFGKKPYPCNYKRFYNEIDRLGISFNKPGLNWVKKRRSSNRLSPKQVFVIGRSGINKEKAIVLRRCLLEIGRGNECEECGISSWRGKLLVLDIHHINRDPLDNTENNLLVLCPNCHRLKKNDADSS